MSSTFLREGWTLAIVAGWGKACSCGDYIVSIKSLREHNCRNGSMVDGVIGLRAKERDSEHRVTYCSLRYSKLVEQVVDIVCSFAILRIACSRRRKCSRSCACWFGQERLRLPLFGHVQVRGLKVEDVVVVEDAAEKMAKLRRPQGWRTWISSDYVSGVCR
jgi:hypothetical protein